MWVKGGDLLQPNHRAEPRVGASGKEVPKNGHTLCIYNTEKHREHNSQDGVLSTGHADMMTSQENSPASTGDLCVVNSLGPTLHS